MENRFRFRAWNTMTKTMKEIAQLTFDEDVVQSINYKENKTTMHLLYQKHIILMQCTGITDVKGNLIYESDILKVVNGSINCIGLSSKRIVKWVNSGWNIEQWTFDSTHYYEVIGNIYQDPELLGEQK